MYFFSPIFWCFLYTTTKKLIMPIYSIQFVYALPFLFFFLFLSFNSTRSPHLLQCHLKSYTRTNSNQFIEHLRVDTFQSMTINMACLCVWCTLTLGLSTNCKRASGTTETKTTLNFDGYLQCFFVSSQPNYTYLYKQKNE